MRKWFLAGGAVLIGGLLTSAAPAPSGAAMVLTARPGYQPVPFTAGGSDVTGLYPGKVKTIKVRLTNPNGYDLRVTTLTGAVLTSSRATCPTTALHVAAFVGTLPVIPAKGTVTAGKLPVGMPATAPVTCQRTTFTVRISGTATKASR